MDNLALGCAAALVVVLAVSGLAKLLDHRGTRNAVVALSVPGRLVGLVSVTLAPVELVLAGLLLTPFGRPAASGAVLLLLAFTGVVVANLLAGRRPSCGCFGGLGSSDVSWRTVARNVLLLGAALVATGERGDLSAGPVVAGLLAGAGLIALEQVTSRREAAAKDDRQADALEAAIAENSDHGRAPDFHLSSLAGRAVSRDDLLGRGRPVLLAFLHPGCSSCRRLAPDVRSWHEQHADRLTVAVVQGEPLRESDVLGDTGDATVLLTSDDTVNEAYGVDGTPAAVLIHPDGRLAAPVAYGRGGTFRLLELALLGDDDGIDADTLGLESRPAPRPTVTVEDSATGAVLFDEANRGRVEVDVLGHLVWQCLDGAASLAEISVDLAAVFEADPAVVEADVLRVVRTVGRGGLLAGVTPARPDVPAEKEPA